MIQNGKLNSSEDSLTDIDVANELILLGTRTIFGVSINKVLNYLNLNQKDVFLKQIEQLKKKRFIRIDEDRFYVNDSQLFYADHIARELIFLPK